MTSWYTRAWIGLLAIGALVPAAAIAQGRASRPVGPITVPPPVVHPQAGIAGPRQAAPAGHDERRVGIPLRRKGFGLLRGGFVEPYLYGTTYVGSAPAPVAQPAAPPVIYYYPVRFAASPASPAAPEPPYDPSKSRTLMISEGVDGGAGVMRIAHAGSDSLQVTWRGSNDPVRSATLFLADSLRRPLVSAGVTMNSPTVTFPLAKLGLQVAFTGLTVVAANGATATTLVPYRRR